MAPRIPPERLAKAGPERPSKPVVMAGCGGVGFFFIVLGFNVSLLSAGVKIVNDVKFAKNFFRKNTVFSENLSDILLKKGGVLRL